MKLERFLHWSLLLVWFLFRYFLDSILQLTDLPLLLVSSSSNSNSTRKRWRIRVPRSWDKDWLSLSSNLVAMLAALHDTLKMLAKVVKALPLLPVPLLLKSSSPLKNCWLYLIYWCTKSLVSSIGPSMEKGLWRFLSNVIAFTARTTTPESNLGWMRPAFFFLILAAIATCRGNDTSWKYSEYNDSSGQVFYSGFSAKIPSCYDGDTCHLQDLAYDGQLLPPLFQKMNVRIKGIDAPERSRGGCPLEHCLGKLSRKVLEDDILQVGNGATLQLLNCQHDKYGKRLLCDIEASSLGGDTIDVASQLLAISPSLAVPYFGKTKTSPWCSESFRRQHRDDPYLQECESWQYT